MKQSIKIVIWVVLAYVLFMCVRHQYHPLPEYQENFLGGMVVETEIDEEDKEGTDSYKKEIAMGNLGFTEILQPYENTHPKLWREAHRKLKQALLALQKSIYLSSQPDQYVNNGGRLIDIAKVFFEEANVRYQAMRGFHECDPQLLEPKTPFYLVAEKHLRKAKIAWNRYVDAHPSHLVSYQSTDGVVASNA
jgi:hypothetical protein